jgi:hypothetical protein
MRLHRILAGLFVGLFLAGAAFAGTVPLLTGPQDPSQLNATLNNVIIQGNATWGLGTINTASGTTTSTCNALRCTISVTGLSTADGGTVSAAMTVTDSYSALITEIHCQVNGYSGTGVPTVVNIVPGAGSFAFAIQNTSASAALNATVPVSCVLFKN